MLSSGISRSILARNFPVYSLYSGVVGDALQEIFLTKSVFISANNTVYF